MKGKYITTDILQACLSHRKVQSGIHHQLEETIAEHRKIKQQFFKKIDAIVQPVYKKDIHQELAATIAAIRSGFYQNPFSQQRLDEVA